MTVSIIAAVARNQVIGKDNSLPWHLPGDMQFFKEKTKGHHVLTGRKNYDSIPEKFRPLPNRTNIVITGNADHSAPGAHIFGSIEEGIEFARNNNETELFIIGGGQIYERTLALDLIDKMYITWVDAEPEGQIHFPPFDATQWREIERTDHSADEKNKYPFSIRTYDKLAKP